MQYVSSQEVPPLLPYKGPGAGLYCPALSYQKYQTGSRGAMKRPLSTHHCDVGTVMKPAFLKDEELRQLAPAFYICRINNQIPSQDIRLMV